MGTGNKISTDEQISTNGLSPTLRRVLLDTAGASIDFSLKHGRQWEVTLRDYPPLLQELRATFVTLQIAGRLRGCIGSLEPHRALVADVAYNAYAAAFLDHRFPPLTIVERGALDIHISLLSLPVLMIFNSEADLLRQIRPGVDGLILEDRGRRGTFLPSVWETLTNPCDFVTHLKLKAGLPSNHWSPTVRVSRYTTESFY
ncbi:AMMECR1 domain-containing protein [Gammaproteobacteria bacterium]